MIGTLGTDIKCAEILTPVFASVGWDGPLVKIYSRIIKKRYFNQKRTYLHRHVSIPVPSKFHKQLEPFLGQNLEMTVAADTSTVTITLQSLLDPAKTFLHDENTMAKTPQPNRFQLLQQHQN